MEKEIKGKTAVVFTLGCKVNECESDSIICGLKEKGYTVFDKLKKADLYVVNTCAVTKEAEKKSRQTASRILKLNKNAKIIYTGCASQKCPSAFQNKADNVLVTGTFGKGKILDNLDGEGVEIFPETKEYEDLLPSTSLKTRSFIKVQDGCDNFCTYCIIPYLRGRNRSRNPIKVKEEILALNPPEAVITGINLSAYDYDGKGLNSLLYELKDVDARIRLGSLEVNVINDDFLSALKDLKNFAPHFHLSLQSGSNNVLKKMNRKYGREEFILKTELIRKYFPDAGITTDIIVGFPTETESDFLDTLSIIDTVRFSDIHPFIFSPREGTFAYKMKDLNYEVKKERLDRLIEKKKSCKEEFAIKERGKVLTVLTEEVADGYTVGYTENYLRVYLPFAPLGKFIKVKINNPFLDGANGEII